jgi:pyruvate/2-oxoglutarate dehydrogenase complex dihydrolipoamide acyltransferase (E2) component
VKVALKLPRVSMNMEEATITGWHKKPGEAFAAGEALYSIETEKTATEIEAPAAGTMLEILVEEGNNIEAGTVVCRIEVEQPK